MAVTILQRPIGVLLSDPVDATINEDYNGFATVNKTSHGLSDNLWVYIICNVEDYNGFWQIDVINANEFALRNVDGTYVSYIVDATITYSPESSTHGWSCAHLPITYRLSNNRWPVNSVDTVRTITNLTNEYGYARLTLSGSLGTFEDLSFVKISNAPNSDLNGVYQILDKISTTSVTMALSYTSVTNAGLIGASIQLYYGNYNIVVRVYAGINSSHEWAAVKPYELAATLELIPDENNEVFFSINEILKSYIETRNNLLLATLPNNTDFWTNFYIETGESYDTSNGYTVSTFETGYTSDESTFEGTAVNAMLDFKNVYSGHLTDYIMNSSTARFLTLFSIPVLFSCSDDSPECYNDISFIVPINYQNLSIKQEFYNSGALQLTSESTISSYDAGVYRKQIEDPSCSYDRVDVSLNYKAPTFAPFNNTRWSNTSNPSNPGVTKTNWSSGVNTVAISQQSNYYLFPFIYRAGVSYTVNYNVTSVESGDMLTSLTFFFAPNKTTVDGSFAAQSGISLDNSSVHSGSVVITPTTSGMGYIGLVHSDDGSVSGSMQVTINSLSVSFTEYSISETKQFDIDCGCANQELRLTWLNNLGGFDYWTFNTEVDYAVDISATGETKKNIFPQWPKSYGETADTIRKQTFRESSQRWFVTTQHLTGDQADSISYIKTSPLVQIINSRKDRRTVIVDADSFTKYTDNQKLITISFNITFTNNNPSQKV